MADCHDITVRLVAPSPASGFALAAAEMLLDDAFIELPEARSVSSERLPGGSTMTLLGVAVDDSGLPGLLSRCQALAEAILADNAELAGWTAEVTACAMDEVTEEEGEQLCAALAFRPEMNFSTLCAGTSPMRNASSWRQMSSAPFPWTP